MDKKRDIEDNVKMAEQQVVLPIEDTLTPVFVKNAVPREDSYQTWLQQHYAMAHVLGVHADSEGCGNGLTLNDNDKIALKTKTTSGLVVDGNGVAVGQGEGISVGAVAIAVKRDNNSGLAIASETNGLKIQKKEISGLIIDADGVAVGKGDGIGVGPGSIGVSRHATSGLDIDGTSKGLKVGQGNGITVGTSTIEVKAGNGVAVDGNGVALKRHATSGMELDGNGMRVGQGNGIIVGATTVGVKPHHGIAVDGSGVSVKAGNGVAVDSNGVAVKRHTTSGMDLDSNGLRVGQGNGITVGVTSVAVKPHHGITVDSNGVGVKAGSGITVDASGVSVNMAAVIPRGVITMFSGTAAPAGWAFCDGTNGTPNLKDKFIKGSSSFSQTTGGNHTKSYTPAGTVSVADHTLTVDQIPSHGHNVKGHNGNSNGYWAPNMGLGYADKPSTGGNHALNTGGGKPHKHNAAFSGTAATIDVQPAFYAIAFIMKL